MRITRTAALTVALAACVGSIAMPAAARTGDDGTGTRPSDILQAERALTTTFAPLDGYSQRDAQPREAVSGDCDQSEYRDRRGDASGLDIVSTTITSDCTLWTITTRFATRVTARQLSVWAVNFDLSWSRGCGGADAAVVAYPEASGIEAYVVRTPSCDRNRWVTLERARVTRPDNRTLQVTISDAVLQDSNRPDWSVGVSSRKGHSVDISPDNNGWVDLQRPLSPPSDLAYTWISGDLRLSWSGHCARGRTRHELTVSKDGRPPRTRTAREESYVFTDLEPESTYVFTITNVCGAQRSATVALTIEVPLGTDL